jgi:hypothetical protein
MLKNRLTPLLLFGLLSGCGGGGGGSTTPVSVPLLSSQASLVNNGFSANFTLSGVVGTANATASGSGTVTDAKAIAATLNGASVLQTNETITGTLTANGNNADLGQTVVYYRNPSTYALMVEDSSVAHIVYPPYEYKQTVIAGDKGSLATAEVFATDKTTKIGTLALSYSVAADSANSLLVTFTGDEFNTGNAKCDSVSNIFRVSTDGTSKLVSHQETAYSACTDTPFSIMFTFQ